jgi:hypothetical protein
LKIHSAKAARKIISQREDLTFILSKGT